MFPGRLSISVVDRWPLSPAPCPQVHLRTAPRSGSPWNCGICINFARESLWRLVLILLPPALPFPGLPGQPLLLWWRGFCEQACLGPWPFSRSPSTIAWATTRPPGSFRTWTLPLIPLPYYQMQLITFISKSVNHRVSGIFRICLFPSVWKCDISYTLFDQRSNLLLEVCTWNHGDPLRAVRWHLWEN